MYAGKMAELGSSEDIFGAAGSSGPAAGVRRTVRPARTWPGQVPPTLIRSGSSRRRRDSTSG